MKPIETPAWHIASKSIMRSFLQSQKTHLILTGSKHSGKTRLLQELCVLLGYAAPSDIPGFTTHAIPHSHVTLTDHITGQTCNIGIFSPSSGRMEQQMAPQLEGFSTLGITSVENAIKSDSIWVLLDELGYLENDCPAFQEVIMDLFEQKRTLTVLRKASTPFLDSLRNRSDVYLFDLDKPVCPIGCVIMASGNSRRFGSNKLLAPFHDVPLICHILHATDSPLFAARLVVTRHPEIEKLCLEHHIPVLRHDFPGQNDTVRLGLSTLLKSHQLEGCVFLPGDQPLLTRESLETILLTFSQCKEKHKIKSNLLPDQPLHTVPDILRAAFRNPISNSTVYGSPTLFDQDYFSELLHLPEDKGGRYLLEQYKQYVHPVYVEHLYELQDVDTPEELKKLELESLSIRRPFQW